MDSDKPSNPSSKAGETDDLIEEMAKLMANEPKQARTVPNPVAPKPETPSSAAGADSSTPTGPSSFGNLARETPRTPSLARETPRTAPEPVATPRAETSGGESGNTPGWLPQPKRAAPEPSRPVSQPVREEPTFGLRPESKPVAPTPMQEAVPPTPVRREPEIPPSRPDVRPSAVDQPAPQAERTRFDFGAPTRETARSEAPTEAPEESRPAFDFGFGSGSDKQQDEPLRDRAPEEQQAPEPEVDPIADLIRHQFDESGPGHEGALREPEVETPMQASAAPGTPRQEPAIGEAAERNDHFNVSPVFGLGGDVSKRPTSGSDALDDIENLIGNAVRVDMPREEPASRPAEPSPRSEQLPPVLQPPVRPRQPARPQPAQRQAPNQTRQSPGDVDPAEAAILAALAASDDRGTGSGDPRSAQTTNYVTADSDEPAMTDGDVQPRRGMRWEGFIMPVVALLLLGALGYVGYLILTSTPSEGDAPVLLADSDPSKVEPATDGATDSGQAVVFDGAGDGSDEQLVSRDQSQGAEDDAIRQIITADTTENGVANRKVRTVTVRPDGTIISGDDQVAGGEALSVDRPDVPALPADAVTSELANTDLSSVIADEGIDGPAIEDPAVGAANLVAVDGNAVPYPASPPANLLALRASANTTTRVTTTTPVVTQPAVTSSPLPVAEEPGAVDLLGDASNEITPLVDVAPPPATAVAQPPVNQVTAAAWVQLASQRDEAIATSEAGRLSRLYSSALGGRELVVQRADLADRGIWYRVLVPASSLSDAQSICVQIQGIGGDCFPRAN